MAFTSGYVTSNTKLRFNTFGGMMTGNTVKLGMSIQDGDGQMVGVYLTVLSSFAIGTLFALVMIPRFSDRRKYLWLLPLCSLFVLVDGLALAVTDDGRRIPESLVSAMAAFALGAQNCLSQKSAVVKANTTFMTGNIQKVRADAQPTPSPYRPTSPYSTPSHPTPSYPTPTASHPNCIPPHPHPSPTPA